MTDCCRKCAKKFCEKRNQIEDCSECISYVWLAMQEIDKKLNIQEKEIDDDWEIDPHNPHFKNRVLSMDFYEIKEGKRNYDKIFTFKRS